VPLSRRALLAASLAAAGPARSADPALRDGARRAGLWFGATPEVDPSAEPDYTALLTSNCDLLAPNLNWQRLSPTPSGPLVAVDGSVAVARAAGLKLTGYHLLWHQRLPVWFDALDRPQAERAIVAHIQTMAAAFGRDSLSWNVVNEAIMPGGLRPSPLTVKFGADFFDLAYRAALESAPNVLRLYNDYDLELATPEHERRRATLLRLLDRLQGRGVPVQAVGLQCHLRTSTFDRFDPPLFRSFLRDLAGRGLAILITELDVLDLTTGCIPARDQAVATVYQRFLEVALAEPRVEALVLWGLSDRHTWLNDPNRPSLRRPDAAPTRPLPFDAELRPKPAFQSILTALASAPPRARPT
jgi:endo-1,4-beta-xylanase